VEDFSVPLHRRLAELYWEHQRHEGEPVFNEFLGHLGTVDAALVDLAVKAVDEVERLASSSAGPETNDDVPDRDHTLQEAIGHLARAGETREAQKLLAELRRTTLERRPGTDEERNNQKGAVPADAGEIALLKQLQEKARTPDLRRVM